MKYVVIYEGSDNGYMDCLGVFDDERSAYGEAYLSLSEGLADGGARITVPVDREGEQGMVMALENEKGEKLAYATVLFWRGEE